MIILNVMINNMVYVSLLIEHNSNRYTNVDAHVSKLHPQICLLMWNKPFAKKGVV